MQEIADWLKSLGMPEYAQCFAENDIDCTILGDLTDQDLKDLGVASLGHRRKLLRAIAALGETLAAAAPEASPPPSPLAPSAAPPSQDTAGERRYLTVMFCDLVGSTAISAQLDVEEWRDLVGAYLDAASAAVAEMGGHVAKKLGDGILALFGYPTAHENDAERAARAALSIQRALVTLNAQNAGRDKAELKARIGLETGAAVVDAAGEIYGDVANVAARVQALAEPGAILITSRVQRQIAGLFVAEDRGAHALKGVPEATVLFRLVRASGGGRHAGQRNLTPLFGRNDEMAVLQRRWRRARVGEGQLVLIVGEPGLGKSRLIEEFHTRLSETPHTWVEWSCSQLLQNTPLHPIAEWGRLRFGGADVPVERRLADLESSLAQVKLEPAELVPLLATLLDFPLTQERMPTLSGEELRRRQLAALINWVLAGAKVQPIVLAFEDLHWADPTTLDVLRGIAEQGALAPLFILATTRPEFRPPWSMRSHHGTISLAPLDRAHVRDMVSELSSSHALSKDVVEDVAARTGGVPLFVEEVTRLLLERGEKGGMEAIPPTLQQSLMARLDRLGPAREVAHVGSVIGRGFSYDLLRDVAGMEDAPLQAALEKLAEADIVLVQGLPPESDYRFKHALIQDAAYENLLKSRRQVLHRRVAGILSDRLADSAAAEPEVLAHHYTQSGLTDAAIEWWGKAGDQALRRSAFQEAISHLGKAIEMADKEGDVGPRATPVASTKTAPDQRLKLQTSYGQALMLSRGFASEESKVAFTRARELGLQIGEAEERFDTYYGLFISQLLRGEIASAREIAETFLRDSEGSGRMMEAAVANRNLGMACLYQGALGDAQKHLSEALRLYNPERDREAKFRFGADTAAAAAIYLAQTNWYLGETSRALALTEEAGRRAGESSHPPTLALIQHLKGMFDMHRDDAAGVLRISEGLLELTHAHGMSLYHAHASVHAGWARARLGGSDADIAELGRAVATYASQGAKLYLPFYTGLLAELEGERQGADVALSQIDDALQLARQTGAYSIEPFLNRARGEILLKRAPATTQPAEDAFLIAIAIARRQKAKSFEIEAAHALAKVYHSSNRAADAHAILAPALEGFSPTPEFPEIEQIQALLATLAEADEVKSARATRQRRLHLQTSYGQALLWSKGYADEEAKAAFTRAEELASGIEDPAERLKIYYGHCLGNLLRGEYASAQSLAEDLLRGAERERRVQETAFARRILGLTHHMQGAFAEAQAQLEKALNCSSGSGELQVGLDMDVAAKAYLSHSVWVQGEFARARSLIDESVTRAELASDIPDQCTAYSFECVFAIVRNDAEGAHRAAERLIAVAEEHGAKLFLLVARVYAGWARAWLDRSSARQNEFQEAIADYAAEGNRWLLPFYLGLLAAIEAETQGERERAAAHIYEALALAQHTGEHWSDAFLHRIRGEILLKLNPANTAPAEDAFVTAIGVARQQKAKSFGLRAALSLAEVYRSTNRAAEIPAVLAPALQGFSQTSEFPEVEQAQRLLGALH